MKMILILATTVLASPAFAGGSQVGSHVIAADSATKFINTYLPEAAIPGSVTGQFSCFVPAMGGASNGVKPGCTINYGEADKNLTGDSATTFLESYVVDAQIPGNVAGQFNCFVPAMGGASNGVKPSCSLIYGTPSDKKISGEAAISFVNTYLPNAPVPGAATALINCSVPAMGGASNGAKATCTITAQDSSTSQISGKTAEKFIDTYMPDAQIPGSVDGQVSCFVPAMGGASNGVKPGCTITTYNQ